MTQDAAIEVRETVWIDLPDGTRLAGRLWLPKSAAETPVPAVLEYIPYRRRDFTRLRDDATHPRFAAAGYAVLRVDLRGSGDSDGIMRDEYTAQELQDGCDVIAWMAAQSWCDGAVGMMGKSWGAYNALQVAALRPPALKAIIPVMGTDDRWLEDIHFRNGVLATDNFWWGSIMQLKNLSPPDPVIVGDRWRDMWRERLDAMTLWTADWLEHQTDDAMWRHGSISQDYSAVEAPVYFFGGWADLYRDTPFRIAEHLATPCKILMGPWAHLYPHDGIPGPKVDFVDEAIRWWDRWLKGIDNGIMDEPRLRFYLLDSVPPATHYTHRPGRWVEETDWPAQSVAPRPFWLNGDGLGAASDTDGPALSICSPQDYGAAGGDMCSFALDGDQPGDCRIDAGGALLFRSAPLAAPVDILGQARLHLSVAADRPQAFAAAVLADEAPDGAQTLITRGFVNLTHRDGGATVTPVTPGAEMDAVITLHGMAYRVPKGHRLVLHLASSYWPILWPAPEPVTLTLRPGRSRLDLTARQASAEQAAPRPLPPPPDAGPRPVTQVREGSMARTVTTDRIDGTVTHRVFIDGGVFGPVGTLRFDATGTEFSDRSERLYTIRPDDPLSARAEMRQTRHFRNGDWSVRLEAYSDMTATRDTFRITAWTECWDGDTLFHRADWTRDIPRHGM